MSTNETSNLEQIKITALNDAAAALQVLAKVVTQGEPTAEQIAEQIDAFNNQLIMLKQILSISADVEVYAAILKQAIAQGGKYYDPQSNLFKSFWLTGLIDKGGSDSEDTLLPIVNNIKAAQNLCKDLLESDITAFSEALSILDKTISTIELNSMGSHFFNEQELNTLCTLVETGGVPAAKKVVYERIFLQCYEETINQENVRPGIILAKCTVNNTFVIRVLQEDETKDITIPLEDNDQKILENLPWPQVAYESQLLAEVEQALLDLINPSYSIEKFYVEDTEHQDITRLNKTQEKLMCTLGCLGLPDEDNDCFRLAHQSSQNDSTGENYLPHIYGFARSIPETFYTNGEASYLTGKRLEPIAKIGRNLLDVNISPEDQYQLAIKSGDIVNFDKLVDICSDKKSPDYYSFFDAAKMAAKNNQLVILKRVVEKEKIESQRLGHKPMNELPLGESLNPTLLFNALIPEKQNAEMIAYLVEEGADILVRNRLRKNVLNLAFEKKEPETILNGILNGLEKRFNAENNKNAKQRIGILREEINNGGINRDNVDAKFSDLLNSLKPPIQKVEEKKRSRSLSDIFGGTKKGADTKKRKRSVSLSDLMPSHKVAKTNAEKTPEEIRLELIKLIDERLESLGPITKKSSNAKIGKVNELHRLRNILEGRDTYVVAFVLKEDNKKKIDSMRYKVINSDDSAVLPSDMKKSGDVIGRLNLASKLLNRLENRAILSQHRNEMAHKTMTKVRETFISAIENLLGRKVEERWRESLSKTALFIETFNKLWSGPTVKHQTPAETKIVAKTPRAADSHTLVTASKKLGVFHTVAERIEESNPVLSKIAQKVQGIKLTRY